jgi:hypothetical protein
VAPAAADGEHALIDREQQEREVARRGVEKSEPMQLELGLPELHAEEREHDDTPVS